METFVLLSAYLKNDVIRNTFENLEPFFNVNEHDGMYYYRVIIILKMLFVLYSVEYFSPNNISHLVFTFSNAYIAYNYREIAILSATAQTLLIFAPNRKSALLVTMASMCILAMNIKPYEFILDLYVIYCIAIYAWETYRKEIQKLCTVVSIVLTTKWYISNLYLFSLATLFLVMSFLFLSYIPLKPNFKNKQRHRLLCCYALIFLWVVYKFQLASYHGMDTFNQKTKFGGFNKRWGFCETDEPSRNVNISIDIHAENPSTYLSETNANILTKVSANRSTSPNEMSMSGSSTVEDFAKKTDLNSISALNSVNASAISSLMDRKTADYASCNELVNESEDLKEIHNELKETKNITSSKIIDTSFSNVTEVLQDEDNMVTMDRKQCSDKFMSNVKSKPVEDYKVFLNEEMSQKDLIKPSKFSQIQTENSKKTVDDCILDNDKSKVAEEVKSSINWERHTEVESIESTSEMDSNHKLMLTAEENVKKQIEQNFLSFFESESLKKPVLVDVETSVVPNMKMLSDNKETYSTKNSISHCAGIEKMKLMSEAKSESNFDVSELSDSIAEVNRIEKTENLSEMKHSFVAEEKKELGRNIGMEDTRKIKEINELPNSEKETILVKPTEEAKTKEKGEQKQKKFMLNGKYKSTETEKSNLITKNDETINKEIGDDILEMVKTMTKADLIGEKSISNSEKELESGISFKVGDKVKWSCIKQEFDTKGITMNQRFILLEEGEKYLISKTKRDIETKQILDETNIQKEIKPRKIITSDSDKKILCDWEQQEEFRPIKDTEKEPKVQVSSNIQDFINSIENDAEDIIRQELETQKNSETFQNVISNFQENVESAVEDEKMSQRKFLQEGFNPSKDQLGHLETKRRSKREERECCSYEIESDEKVKVETSTKDEPPQIGLGMLKDQWKPMETKGKRNGKERDCNSYKVESTEKLEVEKIAKYEESEQVRLNILKDQRKPMETKDKRNGRERECNSYKVESIEKVEAEKSVKDEESQQVSFDILTDQWKPIETKGKRNGKERECNPYKVESMKNVEVENSAKDNEESEQIRLGILKDYWKPMETKDKRNGKERECNSDNVESIEKVEVEKSADDEESEQVGLDILKDQWKPIETKGKRNGKESECNSYKVETIEKVEVAKSEKDEESEQVGLDILKAQCKPMETKGNRNGKECNSYKVECIGRLDVEKSAKDEESEEVDLEIMNDQWPLKETKEKSEGKEKEYDSYKGFEDVLDMHKNLQLIQSCEVNGNAQVEQKNKVKHNAIETLVNTEKMPFHVGFKDTNKHHLLGTVEEKVNSREESIISRKTEQSKSVKANENEKMAAKESLQDKSSELKRITRGKEIFKFEKNAKENKSTRLNKYNMQEEWELIETNGGEKSKQIVPNMPEEPKLIESVEWKTNSKRQSKRYEDFMEGEPELIDIVNYKENKPRNSLTDGLALQKTAKSLKNPKIITYVDQNLNHIYAVDIENNGYSFLEAPVYDDDDTVTNENEEMFLDESYITEGVILFQSGTKQGLYLILRNRNGKVLYIVE